MPVGVFLVNVEVRDAERLVGLGQPAVLSCVARIDCKVFDFLCLLVLGE